MIGPRVPCPNCRRMVTATDNGFGLIRRHGPYDNRCPGSGQPVNDQRKVAR